VSILLSVVAFLFTRLTLMWATMLFLVVLVFTSFASYQLSKAKIDG